jgi:NAD(P)-dependent dehydrogenase (short-subunit alcohol dehydrogenase family)
MAGYRRGLHLPGSVVVVAGAAGAVGGAVAEALAGAGARPVASLHGQVARPHGAPQAMAGAAVRVLAAAPGWRRWRAVPW